MRLLRKLIAFCVYAAVLFPSTDYKVSAWMRAVEITSTTLDRTLRRKKAKLENDNSARALHLMQIVDGDKQEFTGRIRGGVFGPL